MPLQAATQACLRLLGSSLGPSFITQSAHTIAAAGVASSGFRLLQQHAVQPGPSRTSAAGYRTSSLCSQQQQQDGGKAREPTINEQAQDVSKSFITSVLNMEEAWLSGVAGQLKMWAATKKLPELEGKEKDHQDIVENVRTEYLDTFQRAAAGRELSIRARSHLKQACLAAATHKVLLSVSPGSEKHVEEFIMFNLGGVYSSFMLGGLKIGSWAKKWLLRESSMSQAVDTLHTIARVSCQPHNNALCYLFSMLRRQQEMAPLSNSKVVSYENRGTWLPRILPSCVASQGKNGFCAGFTCS
eukprot:GHUV01006118.1.p1 GENE.GHUV01006118.1~~GHUV01006118.1.p1  ORF type:complete len:300 (+),score=82.63 GHUV01006118.1:373-1272(+)